MPVCASIYIFIAVLIIFVPMMMCDYPEMFMHNVEKEFSADDIFETKARIKTRLQNKFKNQMTGNPASAAKVEDNSSSNVQLTQLPLVPSDQVAEKPAAPDTATNV